MTAMSTAEIVELLAAHRTLGSAPRQELEWLASRGTLRHYSPGALVGAKGTPVEVLWIVFTGRSAIFVDRGEGRDKAFEWAGGDVGGILPYSRLVNAPGDNFVLEPMTLLELHRTHLRDLTRDCHTVTTLLVHTMLDRARAFTSSDLRNEKMISLGKLAAGLAHELNNPAAAIERSAAGLGERLDDVETAARVMGATHLTETQLAAVDRLRGTCLEVVPSGVRSPLEQVAREEAVAEWLAAHGVDVSIAESLAETAVTIDQLDTLAAQIGGPALGTALRWAASGCVVRSLASEIQEAAMRVSGLVMAIKGFTHMDQGLVAEPVDLTRGLGNTVSVLRAKARAKSASVAVDVEPGLPSVRGFVGELNQVWANLIDNALDAIPNGGRVEVRATRGATGVDVWVVDNGPGIPAAIRDRIFDPFFTTKPVGQGAGLGLDIVRRLVRHNDGVIDVVSEPGRTEFRVSLPVADPAPASPA
jgi:signal transduction histidine kinase